MKYTPDFSSRFRILKGGKISLVVSALIAGSTMSFAAPSGGVVNTGSATITQNGSVTTIDQSTQRASINWQDFSIASHETVNFNQPSSSAVTLNRVVGNERSVIDGALNANGQVWILNSNGVLFGKDASVNTAGLVASTMNMSDENFMNGSTAFESTGSSASVINTGTIRVTDGGYVALLGKEVANEGLIQATKGTVALAAGDKITLNFNGDSLVGIAIDQGTLNALVENKGAILADGGKIFLTTKAAADLLNGVVNNSGVLQANSLDDVTGHIEVFAHGGTANVGGTIEAQGGFVETSGKEFAIQPNATIKAGEWLIDPVNITIDAGLAQTIQTALGSGDVTITTEGSNTPSTTSGESGNDGDITVNSTIRWNNLSTLTLSADRNIYINGLIDVEGEGTLILNYGQGAVAMGNTAEYNFGNDTEPDSTTFAGRIDLSSTSHFQTKQGSDGVLFNWRIITSLGNAGDELMAPENRPDTLQGFDPNKSYPNSFVALGNNIDATDTVNWNEGSGFDPIADSMMPFMGMFDGLGHSISNLTINRPDESYVGLFAKNIALIRNVALSGATVTGLDLVGGLVGLNNGVISHAHIVDSQVHAQSNGGGLVGKSEMGRISDSYAIGVSVTGGSNLGGLIGWLVGGTLTDSYTQNASVSASSFSSGGLVGYADGAAIQSAHAENATVVSGGDNAGGLIGYQAAGGVYYSWASGSVSGAMNVGGLVGVIASGGIVRSYSTASASGSELVGGLVGYMYQSDSTFTDVLDAYATGNVSGANTIGGLIGKHTLGMITRTYATGAVTLTGAGVSGGLVGDSAAPESITNSFWDTQTTGQATSAAGTGKMTAQMHDIATFADAGWDIATQDNTYPYPSLTMGNGATVWTIPIASVSLSYTLSDILSGYTYNGTSTLLSSLWSASTIFGADYSSWVAGTDYNFIYGGNTVTGFTNAGTYSNIAIDILKSGFTEASSGNTDGSFVIAPKAVTITGTTANTKVYDGTTTATLSDIGSISTGIEGEFLTLNAPTSSVFATKNAGTAKTVTASGYTLSNGAGGLASNYTLNADSVTTTAAITAKAITVSATAADKVYDATTAATATLASSDIIAGDTVTLSGTGTFADKNVGTAKTVTVASLNKTGIDAANYTISNTTATDSADITAKAITVSATTENKIYDGTTDAIATLASSDIIEGDSVTLSGIATFDNANVGEGKTVTVASLSTSGTDGANYTIANESVTATADIVELTLVVEPEPEPVVVVEPVVEPEPAVVVEPAVEPEPVVVESKNDTEDVITATVNAETVHVEVPRIVHEQLRVEVPRTPTYSEGREISLVSAPLEGQHVEKISMNEVTALQKPAQSSSASAVQETRVALYQDSVVDLINGGVNLPEGVHQEFYVVKNDAPTNTNIEKEAN
jgi:filamentous hemagglutinin family protein